MKKTCKLASAFLVMALLAGCMQAVPEISPAESSCAPPESTVDISSSPLDNSFSAPSVEIPFTNSDSKSTIESVSVPVLNQELLSLLDSDNSALKQIRFGRCYAELTMRGTLQITFFSPYLSIQFVSQNSSTNGWLEGGAAGFYEENPFADDLSIFQIDFYEEIDPQTPSLEHQPSLQQLIQTEEPITYSLLCEILQQTPELFHTDDVYYNAAFISEDSAARSFDAKQDYRVGQKITGGEDVAVFLMDDVQIRVSFIHSKEEYFAFHISLEKSKK